MTNLDRLAGITHGQVCVMSGGGQRALLGSDVIVTGAELVLLVAGMFGTWG